VKLEGGRGSTAKILEVVDVGKLLVAWEQFSEPAGQIQAQILERKFCLAVIILPSTATNQIKGEFDAGR
jgi:hypothetical protein